MKKINKKRKPWSHKGDNGYVLIVGGNKWYTGSPAFNAIAALRSGADIASVVAPQRSADIVASFLPDMIAYPLAGDFLKPSHVKEIVKISKSFDSLVIGGGLGVEPTTKKAVIEIIKKVDLPMVIDADAIKAIANKLSIVKNKEVILTPNSKEFEMMTKKILTTNLKFRKKQTQALAKKLNVTILLKGHVDVVSDGQKILTNKTGTVYMTKGGFGDTLAGIAGSLLAQGHAPMVAALHAAKVNGKAGEIASKKFGSGLMASDMLRYISQVIKK